ncbi:MAG: endolytic transglycosylase MltG [Myxococcota bacterium]|nr:endolytic transglycosylase MltG [Myxococcota bacterium]
MKRLRLGLVVLLGLAGAAGAGWYWWRQERLAHFATRPFGSETAKRVEVPAGTGPRTLSLKLAAAGVVSSAEEFYGLIRQEGVGPRLQAGEYEFQGAQTPEEVLEKLVLGKVKTYRFTIPEGLRVDEILPLIAGSELKLELRTLRALSTDPAFLKQAKVPTRTLEGFLFPDTYHFARPYSEEQVLQKMISRTFEEYARADTERKPGVKLTFQETLTLASIIEKETGAPVERPRISCVFHNRLRLGIPLATDPTVLYAMMLRDGRYSKNITRKDLQTVHPYNTYRVKGLPPGPIASAGTAALRAALEPLDCSDLFFVSRNDGTHVFCPDLRCHEEQVRKWQIEFHRNRRR